ncbi:MAG: DNA recombination protein RmuC [Chloroflexi bacterium]|nr:DNA recombination protein RmuC [Chloroflexota bacterium]
MAMEIWVGLVFLAAGLGLGAILGWLIRGSRADNSGTYSESERQAELANLQLKHEQALAERNAEWAESRLRHEQELGAKQEEISRLNGQLEQTKSAQEILESAKTQLGEQFKATATDVLQASNRQFMELSEQSLGKTMAQAKTELEQRHTQFQELVKPLSENYGKLNPQIELLIEQSNRVSTEANRLTSALTDNRQAGHWGEVQLRKVVEAAGMSSYCDFDEQGSVGAAQQARPDLVVNLPEKRAIVIDAKASTLAFMEAQQAEDEDVAEAAWLRHAQAMRRQIDDLAGKNYGNLVEGSLDFVVMFVPGDQFLSAALGSNPGLVEYAMGKRVAIATPASLIAMLWAVNNGWQQFRVAEEAARIKNIGEEMFKRLTTFMNHYARVGKQLESAVSTYNSSVSSFDRRVVPQGRRFAELVVGADVELSAPDIVDELPVASAYSEPIESPAAADN